MQQQHCAAQNRSHQVNGSYPAGNGSSNGSGGKADSQHLLRGGGANQKLKVCRTRERVCVCVCVCVVHMSGTFLGKMDVYVGDHESSTADVHPVVIRQFTAGRVLRVTISVPEFVRTRKGVL